MKKIVGIFQPLFGVPWLVFGVQHFVYASFVAGLVPAYFPARIFWVYLTGAAMIAAGFAFIFNRKASLAAVLLGTMLVMFLLLIHASTISGDTPAIKLTRILQDIALAAIAFVLAGITSKQADKSNLLKNISTVSRYLLAILLIVFGVQQFFNLDFLTGKVPVYLPLRTFWVYLTGAWMIITGVSVFINKKARLFAAALGAFLLLLNLLNYVPSLASESRNALLLTAAMLDLAITCGVFILANSLPEENLSVERVAP